MAIANTYDVLILGAGAAGLVAAWECAATGRKVAVIEARDRIGGRVHTMEAEGFSSPVEAGAEFIHGDLPLTSHWVKKAGLKKEKVDGSLWRADAGKWQPQKGFIEDMPLLKKKFRKLKGDRPVALFMAEHLSGLEYEDLRRSLTSYVEGYYAASLEDASTRALQRDLEGSEKDQYRIIGGYQQLLHFIFTDALKKGVSFYFSSRALEIRWKKEEVAVHTTTGTYIGNKLICTLPVGVLRSGMVRFLPALAAHENALSKLGFGPVVKGQFLFDHPFWKQKDLAHMAFVFSEEPLPTWWTQYPGTEPVLTAWAAGPHAAALSKVPEEDICMKAMHSLSLIFGIDHIHLQQMLESWKVTKWNTDPFTLGGYSFEVVDGEKYKRILRTPEEDTLFFAGEALFDGVDIGTVEAALQSGREAAHVLITTSPLSRP